MHRCRVNLRYTRRWFYFLLFLPGDQHPGLCSLQPVTKAISQAPHRWGLPATPPPPPVFCSAQLTVLHLFISRLPSAVTTCSEANRFPSWRVTGRTGETSCHPRDGPDQHQEENPLVNWQQEGKRQWQRCRLKILQNWPLCDQAPHWTQREREIKEGRKPALTLSQQVTGLRAFMYIIWFNPLHQSQKEIIIITSKTGVQRTSCDVLMRSEWFAHCHLSTKLQKLFHCFSEGVTLTQLLKSLAWLDKFGLDDPPIGPSATLFRVLSPFLHHKSPVSQPLSLGWRLTEGNSCGSVSLSAKYNAWALCAWGTLARNESPTPCCLWIVLVGILI